MTTAREATSLGALTGRDESQGASEWFTALYSEYFERGVRWLEGRYRLGRATAEDLVQNLFTELWQTRSRVVAQPVVFPWAFVCSGLRMQYRDYCRYGARQCRAARATCSLNRLVMDADGSEDEVTEGAWLAVGGEDELVDQVMAREALRVVGERLRQVPARHRRLLALAVAGWSHQEIATLCQAEAAVPGVSGVDWTVVGVRSRLCRVRRVLRRRTFLCSGCGREQPYRGVRFCARCYSRRWRERHSQLQASVAVPV